MTSDVAKPARGHSVPGGVPVLEARNLTAGYGEVPVLHGISLRVGAGQIVALLGANGAGKTTLLFAIAGRLPLLSGQVIADGRVTVAPLYRRARDGLGLVTDDRSIFRGLTALDNLRVGRVQASDALELFPELKPRLGVVAGLLSGGEQQMLTLARALARRPKVLLIDELSLGLAPQIVQRLLGRLSEAATQSGTAVLLVEQHIRKALEVADYGYILSRGRIAIEGDAMNLRGRMSEIESSYLSSGSS
ncbi:MAG TPA: ABC transporter ATP-binding protein [Streptosporangiaceae bacterium]|nr:ABC transporter ATP-binding protein [Streptosporangiaceae bacterium]